MMPRVNPTGAAFNHGPCAVAVGALLWVLEGVPVFAAVAVDSFTLGKEMFHRGLYQAAYRYLENYLSQTPYGTTADEAQFYLGRALQEMGSYDEAVAEYKRVITNYPTSRFSARALIHIGECFAAAGNTRDAIEYYQRALTLAADPEDQATALLKLGEGYFLTNDVDGAIAVYEDLRHRLPDRAGSVTVNFRLALLYFLKGDAETMRKYFEAARAAPDASPGLIDAVFGECLLSLGAPDEARAVLTAAERETRDPTESGRITAALAASALAAGDAPGGREALEKNPSAAQSNPRDYFYILGFAYASEGATTAAREAFLNFARRFPDDERVATATLWAGRLAADEGRFDEAAAIFADLAAKNVGAAPQAHYWEGWAHFQAGDYEAARNAFIKVREDNAATAAPFIPYARYWAAECAARLGANRAARDEFGNFATSYSDHALADNALLRAGKLFSAAGLFKQARETFAALAERYRDGELADDAAYYYAHTFLDEKNVKKAIAAYWDLVRDFPASHLAPQGLYDLGYYQFGEHDFTGAERTFTALLYRYPNFPEADEVLFLLGECFLNQAAYEKAKTTYRELITRFPNSARVDEARYEIELCNFKEGRYASQIELAKSYIAMYPQSKLNSKLLLVLGDHYYQIHDYEQAEKYYAAVPATTAAPPAELKEAHRKLAAVYLARGDRRSAVEHYRVVATTAADEEESLSAFLAIMNIFEETGDYDAAVRTGEEALARVTASPRAAEVQLKMAGELREVKLFKESNATLTAMLKKWPDSEFTPRAQLLLGLNYQDLGDFSAAKNNFLAAAAAADREVAVAALFNLGLCEKNLGNTAAARSYFLKVVTNYRDFPLWLNKANSELKSSGR